MHASFQCRLSYEVDQLSRRTAAEKVGTRFAYFRIFCIMSCQIKVYYTR